MANSKNPKDWTDWQRVLYYWRYVRGHHGLSINLLAHVCKRPARELLQELKKDGYVWGGVCNLHLVTVFFWAPWGPGQSRIPSWGPRLHADLRKWPPGKYISVSKGRGEKGPRISGKISITQLRRVAAANKAGLITIRGEVRRHVWF